MASLLSERASGVLLHLTSLPGRHGCGVLGPQAHACARWLRGARQRFWQMLPVGPIGYGNSPYSALSAFAGNPLLISLDRLVDEGLLPIGALADPPRFPDARTDYQAARAWRGKSLMTAFAAFARRTSDHPSFEIFCSESPGWLEGYPLYRWAEATLRWWLKRFASLLSRFDAVRLDHFIGFVRYWEIAASDPTAERGTWIPGPGARLFDKLGPAPLIAEDLGAVTPEVTALRDRFGYPGIKLLQFAFGNDPQAPAFLPHNYQRNSVA